MCNEYWTFAGIPHSWLCGVRPRACVTSRGQHRRSRLPSIRRRELPERLRMRNPRLSGGRDEFARCMLGPAGPSARLPRLDSQSARPFLLAKTGFVDAGKFSRLARICGLISIGELDARSVGMGRFATTPSQEHAMTPHCRGPPPFDIPHLMGGVICPGNGCDSADD
jgi:hypothetical protein